MKSLYSTTAGLLLLALLVLGMASLAGRPLPGGATLRWLQQETPPDDAPCLSASDHGFTFAFLGYRANDDGTHTLTYRITNAGKHDVSHAAFGTAGWTRVEPAEGSTYRGELGDYQVEWTNNKGNPAL